MFASLRWLAVVPLVGIAGACLPTLAPRIRVAGPHVGMTRQTDNATCMGCHVSEQEALAAMQREAGEHTHGSGAPHRHEAEPAHEHGAEAKHGADSEHGAGSEHLHGAEAEHGAGSEHLHGTDSEHLHGAGETHDAGGSEHATAPEAGQAHAHGSGPVHEHPEAAVMEADRPPLVAQWMLDDARSCATCHPPRGGRR